ncbi:MAG: 3-oxoacyl-[acyl-carrier-protein] reductase [Rhodobiaceae bacterium]|jgi:3-oxoacyl-[acyl-carrier protein] reductase|nr:3-oxoacyl-[acyl-carrier-protein] reductase [Rhodobiaceae bacterium]|tara:strand:- start:5381 stop:6118 length:738 start_codon:yes stop_codon:yes gene_type:complete
MFDLKNKKALVTGASGGIGKEIAKVLNSHGAEVCLSGRNTDELEILKNSLKGDNHLVKADLLNSKDIPMLIEETEEKMGQIDILVNNAGITKDNIFLRMNDKEWDDVMAVNLTSVFKISKLAVKGMIKRRYGRIINITSVVAFTGGPGQANYSASKAGVIGMSKSLSQEVASRQITVNCIAPGYIETNMTKDLDEKRKNSILDAIPSKRLGLPADLSSAVIFLASEESGYLTGQTIHVNGGLLMN